MQRITVSVNGLNRNLVVSDDQILADVLRKQLLLTGCKATCMEGHCGACSVIMDDKIVRSCLVKMKRVPSGTKITTIEGLGTAENLHPLQIAWMAYGGAQCGICTPGFIMASKALLDVNKNPTRDEVREFWTKNRNACRCTGYKPLVDAVMAAAKVLRGEMRKEELLFTPKNNESILGTTYQRPSALQKVTGTWDYGADLALHMPPGTLHLALVQAQVSHAKIKGIDSAEAEKMPGVVKVITYKDVKGKNRINGLTFPANKGDGWDRPILCEDKVFQFGDAIAIVAANTEEQAKAAAEKVKVNLEVLPAYMSGFAALAKDAIEIHPGTPNAYFEQGVIKGEDTKAVMAKAAFTAEDETYCSRQPHLHIEPDCGQAFIDTDGVVTIFSKSIGIHLHHLMIAPGLGVEPEKLRIIQNPTGGTFGYKFSPTMEGLLGVATMAVGGRPVSLVYDQFQNITYTGKRSPGNIKLKMGCDKDGKLVAAEYTWWIDHGPYSEFGDLLTQRQAQFTCAGYKLPNIRALGQTVCTNHGWGSAFRSYGSPQAFLASETVMDRLAEKAGIDPFEFRYKNIYRPGDTTPNGCPPDVYCFEPMFDLLRPKYEEAKKRCKELSTPDKKRGVGISLGIYGCGLDGVDSSEAAAELTRDGVAIYNAWEDHGQGSDLGTLTYAHEIMRAAGFKPEQIKLCLNDTKFPNSGPSGGSRQNVMTGHAITNACKALLAAMKKPNGTYRTYEEMVAEKVALRYNGKHATSQCSAIDTKTGQGNPFSCYMYAVFMPEVEVDMKTGKVKVVKFTTVHDIGTIINKATVDGQIYGGLAQGVGLALTEDFDDLKKHTSLLACGIPYPTDIPDDMEIIYHVTPRPNGPHGAAGVGEAPLTAPHPAILNAIYNACGVRISKVPALPPVVKEGIEKLARK